jgi:hypothetical protein
VELGRYTGRRVDFSKYAASFFNPHLFHDGFRLRSGCGATALALLTGVAPEIIAQKNGTPHYADDFMIRFLRRRGFSVLALTQCSVSAATNKVGGQHVVLLSQLFRKNEGTWGVLFNDTYFHNFHIFRLTTLSMLNKPILSAYLVMHSRWRLSRMREEKPGLKTKSKSGAPALAELRGMRGTSSPKL